MRIQRILLILLLCIVLLSSSIQSVAALPRGYSRSLVGEFHDMDITINDRFVTLQEEPFFYEGLLYVPLGPLSQYLPLQVAYHQEDGYINLLTGGFAAHYTDQQYSALLVQRNYLLGELEKERKQLEKKVNDRVEEAEAPPVQSVRHQSLSAWNNNLDVRVDGQWIPLMGEVLEVNGTLYLALVDLADHFYFSFTYDESEQRLDIVSDNFLWGGVPFQPNQLNQKESAIDSMLYEIASLEQQLERRQNQSYPFRQITSVRRMEAYLRDYFEDFQNMDLRIYFSHSRNHEYRLQIRLYEDDLDFLSRNDYHLMEGLVEEIWDVIQDLYDSDAQLVGSIRNIPDASYGPFSIFFETDGNNLVFDHDEPKISRRGAVDASRLERELQRNLRRYDRGSREVTFRYEVVANRRDIDLNIYFTGSRFYQWRTQDKMDYLVDLQREVKDLYGQIGVHGTIIDESRDKTVLRFSFEQGQIRSYDLLAEIEAYLNRHYSRFSFGGEVFIFDFSLSEEDLESFDLRLEGDFAQQESGWRRVEADGTNEFEDFVQDAVNYIKGFWDADVHRRVYDKNLSTIEIL